MWVCFVATVINITLYQPSIPYPHSAQHRKKTHAVDPKTGLVPSPSGTMYPKLGIIVSSRGRGLMCGIPVQWFLLHLGRVDWKRENTSGRDSTSDLFEMG